jgi:hypothetical protein
LCGGVECLKSGRSVSFIPENSMAAGYSGPLRECLPEGTEVRLVAKGEGRGTASVNLFIGASEGRTKTLTFVETENGNSICGGCLDVAWVERSPSYDSRRAGLVFTLKNQLGVPPTKFVQKRDDYATYMRRDDRSHFGRAEGLIVWKSDAWLNCGQTYDAPGQGGGVVLRQHRLDVPCGTLRVVAGSTESCLFLCISGSGAALPGTAWATALQGQESFLGGRRL